MAEDKPVIFENDPHRYISLAAHLVWLLVTISGFAAGLVIGLSL